MVKRVKNNTGAPRAWVNQEIQPGEYYQIQSEEETRWANDSTLLTSIAAGDAIVNDGDSDLTDVNQAINHLKGRVPHEVVTIAGSVFTPTSPMNEYDLKPYGALHKHINSSSQIFDITLSNKDGATYDYSCSVTPAYYDCIFNDTSEVKDGILSEDSGSLTTFYGLHGNGTVHLSKPVDIDYCVYDGDHQMFQLWGAYFSAKDFGDDDVIRLQIVDKDGVGVSLGLYTQEEFDYMGEVVLKEYDECWVNQIDKIGKLMTPDGAPGEIYAGLFARAKYYSKDPSKTDVKMWVDYIITVKE